MLREGARPEAESVAGGIRPGRVGRSIHQPSDFKNLVNASAAVENHSPAFSPVLLTSRAASPGACTRKKIKKPHNNNNTNLFTFI